MCYRCGKPLDDDTAEYCHDCRRKEFYFERCVAGFAYSDAMKSSMYAFKYNNRREYAGFYAHAVMEKWGKIITGWRAGAIVPVPLHRARMRKRGYNQAEVFAGALSVYSGIPTDGDVISRCVNTAPLKTMTDREREKGIKNAFQIRQKPLQYKKIILADDIYTTGATVNECARVLMEAGAEAVYAVTVCVGRGF